MGEVVQFRNRKLTVGKYWSFSCTFACIDKAEMPMFEAQRPFSRYFDIIYV